MAEYHDLSSFLETSRTVLSQIIHYNNLVEASIEGPVRSELGVPSLILKWEPGEGIEKKIQVSVLDDPEDPIVEVEINALKEIERHEKNRADIRRFRRMVCKSVETLRNIQQFDSAKAFLELNAALWQAYVQVSRLDLSQFPDDLAHLKRSEE